MSTHCQLIHKQGTNLHVLFQHFDGYPSFVLDALYYLWESNPDNYLDILFGRYLKLGKYNRYTKTKTENDNFKLTTVQVPEDFEINVETLKDVAGCPYVYHVYDKTVDVYEMFYPINIEIDSIIERSIYKKMYTFDIDSTSPENTYDKYLHNRLQDKITKELNKDFFSTFESLNIEDAMKYIYEYSEYHDVNLDNIYDLIKNSLQQKTNLLKHHKMFYDMIERYLNK